MERVPPPWLLKPRSEGFDHRHHEDRLVRTELWQRLETLGDRQSHYVLERYLPGEVFHVDSLVYDRQVVFCRSAPVWPPSAGCLSRRWHPHHAHDLA